MKDRLNINVEFTCAISYNSNTGEYHAEVVCIYMFCCIINDESIWLLIKRNTRLNYTLELYNTAQLIITLIFNMFSGFFFKIELLN